MPCPAPQTLGTLIKQLDGALYLDDEAWQQALPHAQFSAALQVGGKSGEVFPRCLLDPSCPCAAWMWRVGVQPHCEELHLHLAHNLWSPCRLPLCIPPGPAAEDS